VTPPDDGQSVADMLECARLIQGYIKGRRREIPKDGMLRDALLRRFEVMGEAATRVGMDFRARNPDVPWKRIIAFRNVLIHAYDRIEPENLLAAVDALPQVMQQLKAAR
jgi:uncharacterized protein with HEPN domain